MPETDLSGFRQIAEGSNKIVGYRESEPDEKGTISYVLIQQFLNFLPLPQGQGSLRPMFIIHFSNADRIKSSIDNILP